MKKLLLILGILAFLQVGGTEAGAVSFTFEGVSEGGTGSAEMDITIVGDVLTLTLENTSPITLNSPLVGPNSPGIVGFGFDVENDPLPSIDSWSMTAYEYDVETDSLEQVVVGGNPTPGTDEWGIVVDDKVEGVEMDYMAVNSGGSSNVDAALFNPDAFGNSNLPGGSSDNYYTTAVLMINFSEAPVLEEDDFSVYVRMQVVGRGGSLKLFGIPSGGGQEVPEPATLLLLGSGLMGAGFKARKRGKK